MNFRVCLVVIPSIREFDLINKYDIIINNYDIVI
jgi:hypothetical protein